MRRRTLLMALPLTAVLASCGVTSRAGKGSSTGASSGASHGGFEVTDIVGRKVTFDAQPKNIVLSESRHVYSLVFLNKDNPIDKVVAWGDDLQKAAPDFYDKVLSVAPKAADLPTIGSIAKDNLPIETLVKYKPDVFIMTLDVYNSAKEKGYLDKLDGQKIAYVVTDFRRDPVKNTVPSVTLLGALFDKRKEAEAFVSFYKKQVDPIDHLRQCTSIRDKEGSRLHIPAVGTLLTCSDCLDKLKDILTNHLEHVFRTRMAEYRPAHTLVRHLLFGDRVQPVLPNKEGRILYFGIKVACHIFLL